MFYFIKGNLTGKGEGFAVVENNGIGFKIFMAASSLEQLTLDSAVKLFCELYFREESGPEIYGFAKEEELNFFGLLHSVSGVGPKTALNIIAIDRLENLMAAILENRPDLLTRASGIGRKTAERIILELKSKIKMGETKTIAEKLDSDAEIEEILNSLGYPRHQIKDILRHLSPRAQKLEERLREALRLLNKK